MLPRPLWYISDSASRRADDLAAAGEVRSRHECHQFGMAQCRIADQRDGGTGDFKQVVRRDLGRQADRDAGRAIEQHERQAARQQRRFFGRAVVVGLEIDGAHVDFIQQQSGDRRQPRFGVAHRRRAVAVARAEIALAVDQRVAQREILRHPHQRVVHRLVAVRMQLAQHVADHRGGFARLGGRIQAQLVHRIQDAALHRFLAVADVRQRAPLDHRDRVIEVGAFGESGQRQDLAVGRRWFK